MAVYLLLISSEVSEAFFLPLQCLDTDQMELVVPPSCKSGPGPCQFQSCEDVGPGPVTFAEPWGSGPLHVCGVFCQLVWVKRRAAEAHKLSRHDRMSAKTNLLCFQHAPTDCSFPSTADIPTLCNLCFLLKFYHQSVRNVVVMIIILIQGQPLLTCWLHVNLWREAASCKVPDSQCVYQTGAVRIKTPAGHPYDSTGSLTTNPAA